MGEFLEGHNQHISGRERARFEGVRSVIHALTAQVLHEPPISASDHYRPPEAPQEPTPPEVPTRDLFVGDI